MNANFPAFDVCRLSAALRIHEIITATEAAQLKKAVGPDERARLLFQEIMPVKDEKSYDHLVTVFNSNGMGQVAAFLDARLKSYRSNRTQSQSGALSAALGSMTVGSIGSITINQSENQSVNQSIKQKIGK